MDPSFYFSDYGDELDEAVESGRKGRFWKRFLIYVFLLVAIAAAGVFVARRYLEPIDLDKASPDRAISWLLTRDLTAESPETQDKLFELYLDGVSVEGDVAAGDEEFGIPDGVKKYSGLFLSGRDEKVSKWRLANPRTPLLRLDYRLVPIEEATARFAVSSDVEPGPALLARWNKRRAAIESGAEKKTRLDRNVQLLVYRWAVARTATYDQASDAEKAAVLDAAVDELYRFQKFYNEIREAAKKRAQTRDQSLRELESTLDGWLDFAVPEDLAKAYWFMDVVQTRAVLRELPVAAKFVSSPPKVPTKKAESAQGELGDEAKPFEFDKTPFGKALDAAKSRIWKKE